MKVKSKIYISLTVWLALCLFMFMYGLKFFDKSNRAALGKISEQNKELVVLRAQQESYRLAQKDLDEIAQAKYQPSELFSKDVTLVDEIEYLESLEEKLGVKLTLSGISGTFDSSKKKTPGSLFTIPFSVSVNGPLNNVVDFIETFENLEFASRLNSLSISSGDPGLVNVSTGANLYIKKE